MTDTRVPAVVAPETEPRHGRVRVVCGDRSDVRTVAVADNRDAWRGWAHQIGFELQNMAFVTIGDAVYRSATVDHIEPIQGGEDPLDEALQAALAVLTMIRDLELHDGARELAAELLRSVENKGITLRE